MKQTYSVISVYFINIRSILTLPALQLKIINNKSRVRGVHDTLSPFKTICMN